MAQAADIDPPKKGGLMKVLMLFVGAAILAGAGFGAGFFLSSSRPTPSDEVLRLIDRAAADQDGPEKQIKDRGESAFETNYYEFPDPLTTNLRGSRKFVQIGIGISTQYDERVIANVERHAMALRSDMLAILGGLSEDEITGKDGRDMLSATLRDAMNARLENLEGFGGVEDVFFPTFVLQ